MPDARSARLVLTAAAAVALLLRAAGPSGAAPAPVYGYQVLAVHPHDRGAYIQGLIYKDGYFYEGTGLWGESTLRKVEIQTGAVLKRVSLGDEYFGEGVTALRDTLYQITWQNNEGFTWVESDSFNLVQAFPWAWEGWGLTHNGVNLITSDGSSYIRYLDPHTRQLISEIQVRDDGTPVGLLNELEYVDGRIYSNVYGSDRIAVIHATTGRVEAWLDLSGLRDSVEVVYPPSEVMNGIAYDPGAGRLWVTGKRWPKLFQIEVAPLHWAGAGDEPPPVFPEIRISPNPCAASATVRFGMAAPGPVSLRLFNIEGRLLRTLLDEHRNAGNQVAAIDVGDIPSGTYFLKLAVGPASCTREFRVVR